MYELSILKSFIENPSNYKEYRNYIKKEDFLEELLPILGAIDQWYKTETTAPAIEDVANLVFAGNTREKDRGLLKSALSRIDGINGVATVGALLEKFKADSTLIELSTIAYDAQRGHKTVSDVISVAKKLEQPVVVKTEFVTDDLDEIVAETIRSPGLRWRLDSLNKSLGSLRKGDFGFVFARPETGKTTFLASEATFMASQLKEESSGPILWFNNEEQGRKVKFRCYESALGWTKEQILGNMADAKKKYSDVTKGKIKIYDNASIHWREVEYICNTENPSLIIFDQIDKIKGFSSDREDLVMGAIYQWAREIAKTYAPVIGVCQADGTAEGEPWLYMGHVANAKTAKQSEADFILGIGKRNESGYENIRYINISKNKLTGDPDTESNRRHARIEVILDAEIARYRDIQ